MVKKAWINYWIDIGLLVSFFIVAITGIIKWPGLIPKLGISYAALPLRPLTNLHDFSGLAMVVLAMVHVILHWRWLVIMTKKLLKK